MSKIFLLIGSVSGFLAVALGAFGAHILKGKLTTEMIAIFETGLKYHLFHTLAILIVGILIKMLPPSPYFSWSGWLFLAGILIFSGSLYLLSISGFTILGAVTPLGGLAFLTGWVLLVIGISQVS